MPILDPDLTLDPRTAFFIALKAREFAAKVEEVDPDEGSNPSDDKAVDVLEFQAGDAVEAEVAATLDALNEDAWLDLIALAWIGRGDFAFDDWGEARGAARRVDRGHAARYVLGHPAFSDALEDALSRLGYAIEDYLDSGIHLARAPQPAGD